MRAANSIMAALICLPLAALAQGQAPSQEQTPSQEQSPSREAAPPSQAATGHSALEEGQTSSSCISHITFSQEFLARYPKAGGACREVKMENGEKWARFDAEVARVRQHRVTANFVDRYGNSLATVTFDAAPEARVEVNGRSERFSDLKRGDMLTFWMPASRVGFYAAPGTKASSKLAVVGNESAER